MTKDYRLCKIRSLARNRLVMEISYWPQFTLFMVGGRVAPWDHFGDKELTKVVNWFRLPLERRGNQICIIRGVNRQLIGK